MHRPPLSKERTGGGHFGEKNSWRWARPSCPFRAPTTPQPRPPLCGGMVGGGGGHLLRREHLPCHSPVSHEEGGVKHLPLPRFTLERQTTCARRILRWDGLFSGHCPHSRSVLRGGPDHRPEGGALSQLWSAPSSELRALEARSRQRGCTPKSLILSST